MTARRPTGGLVVLLGLFLLPRLVRAAWPMARFDHADAVLRALAAARGGDVGTMGLAEWLLARLVVVFGPNMRMVEALSTLAALLTAYLVLRIGTALAGRWAGGAAALAWSFSVWSLDANLFEPALLAAVGTATLLALSVGTQRLSRARWAGITLTLMLTTLVPSLAGLGVAAALATHRLLTGRRREAGLLFLAAAVAQAIGVTLLGSVGHWPTALHPDAMMSQAPWTVGLAVEVLVLVDAVMAAGILSLLLIGLRNLSKPIGAIALIAVVQLSVLVVVVRAGGDLTTWRPWLIQLTLPLAILAGVGLDRALAPENARATGVAAALGLTLVVSLIGFDVFAAREPFLRDAVATRWAPGRLGFGFMGGKPRDRVLARARYLALHSQADDTVVCAEGWEAFLADRPDWRPFLPSTTDDLPANLAVVLETSGAPSRHAGSLAEAGFARVVEDGVAGWVRPD